MLHHRSFSARRLAFQLGGFGLGGLLLTLSGALSGGCVTSTASNDSATGAISVPATPAEKAYTQRVSAELAATKCTFAPSELFLDASARTDISWPMAFSMLWLSWANLDERSGDANIAAGIGQGEAAMYKAWNLSVVATGERKALFIPRLGAGAKYTITKDSNAYYVTFRHSDSALDWLNNMNLDEVPASEAKLGFALGASGLHKGFYDALKDIYPQLIADIDKIPKAAPIVLSGHSLGAAMAMLSSAGLAARGNNVVGVYLSGTPRVAGEDPKKPGLDWGAKARLLRANLGNLSLEQVTHRISHGYDGIARIPVNSRDVPAVKTLLTTLMPRGMQDPSNPFGSFVKSIGNGSLSVFIRALGGSLPDYSSYSAEYRFDGQGVFSGVTTPGSKDNTRFWQDLTTHVNQPNTTFVERSKTLASTLNYHFVRNPNGYGCTVLGKMREDAGLERQFLK